jgi:hypothetical protein
MRRNLHRVAAAAALGLLGVIIWASPVAARESVDPGSLNPAPPASFGATCERLGNQIVCDLAFSDPPFANEPSGIVCGSTELLVSQTRDVVGKRFYNANGDLLQRHFREDLSGTFTNPATGKSADWVAHNTVIHNLATPGDIASGTLRVTGQQARVSVAGGGTILMDAGRIVGDEATGEILSSSGPHHFDDYFVRGDADALQAICDALD